MVLEMCGNGKGGGEMTQRHKYLYTKQNMQIKLYMVISTKYCVPFIRTENIFLS
jgi:hypothetical protein